MSTDLTTIPVKPPTVVERAALVFAGVQSEADLKALAKSSETIVTITNEAGKDQCHVLRMALKNQRLEIARIGEEGREDAVQTSKAIIARQKALIAIIEPEEERLAAIQKAWDDRIKAEKEAKIQAELARVAEIQRLIDGILSWPVNAVTQSSALVAQMLTQADDYRIEGAVFQEFVPQATDALMVSRAALSGLLAQRKAHEAEQARIQAEREELATLRAHAAERERLAKDAQAKADAEAKAERDRLAAAAEAERRAEAARVAEANRLERQRLAEEEAAAKTIRDAEAERLRLERIEYERIASERRAALDREEAQAKAESAALAKERAEFAAQQEAARIAPKPAKSQLKRLQVVAPSKEKIIEVVSAGLGLSAAEAVGVLSLYDWRAEVAA